MNEEIYSGMLGELWGMAAQAQTAMALNTFEYTLLEQVEAAYGTVPRVQISSADSSRLHWVPVYQGGPFSPNASSYDPHMAIL